MRSRVYLKVAEAGQRILRLYRQLHLQGLVNYTYLRQPITSSWPESRISTPSGIRPSSGAGLVSAHSSSW